MKKERILELLENAHDFVRSSGKMPNDPEDYIQKLVGFAMDAPTDFNDGLDFAADMLDQAAILNRNPDVAEFAAETAARIRNIKTRPDYFDISDTTKEF